MAKEKAAPKRDPKPARALTLSASWAAVVLALLTVLFFHEVSVGGKTFVSPDATAPAGFVRIGEQSLWKDHVYPLWNPFVFLGMPSFASGAYNPLIYPPDWPIALVQKVVPLPDMTWMLLYYFLGGFFFFLLAREWGARPEGALLGAVAFAFVPNLVAVGSHGHGSQLVDSAYLPLLVWLASRWLRRGSLTDLGWLALAGGFQFLRGHLQVCVYTWMAVGMLVVVDVIAALRTPSQLLPRLLRAAAVGAAAALAFGLAGFYNLPLKDYSQYSIRGTGDAAGGVGIPYATAWSMAPYELGALVVPNAVGFGGATYWGAMPFTDYPNAYIGVVAMLLAALMFARFGGAARVWAVLLGVFALLVSFGSHFPLYGFLYDHLPQFNKFRVPVMVILLFHFAVALGMAWGWTNVLEADDEKRRAGLKRLLLVLGGVLGVAALAALFGQEALRGPYVAAALAHKQPFTPQQANAAFDGLRGRPRAGRVHGADRRGGRVVRASPEPPRRARERDRAGRAALRPVAGRAPADGPGDRRPGREEPRLRARRRRRVPREGRAVGLVPRLRPRAVPGQPPRRLRHRDTGRRARGQAATLPGPHGPPGAR